MIVSVIQSFQPSDIHTLNLYTLACIHNSPGCPAA